MVELTDSQRLAVEAICERNNFCLFSEGRNGALTCIMHGSGEVLAGGLRDIAKNKDILDIMTNIVIDAQTCNSK